jgi:hypothetical protein
MRGWKFGGEKGENKILFVKKTVALKVFCIFA